MSFLVSQIKGKSTNCVFKNLFIVTTKKILKPSHYYDVIMGPMASQITRLTIVYSAVYSGADKRTHQSSASLAFVGGIHRSPVNSLHKWPVTLKMFPFDDVIMHYWTLKTSKLCIADFLWQELSMTCGFAPQRASNAKSSAMPWPPLLSFLQIDP